uniref:Leucine-rich repeat-containing N-terminal plant-type domain-containing protein n=1 Tax=Oryza brachyantha TaxID=4533 RepID=J3M4N0_ORYBR
MTSKLPPFHVFSLLLLLLVLSSQLAAAFGVWINGDPPSPDASSAQGQGGGKEYAALQAVRAAVVEDPRGALASWQGPNVNRLSGAVPDSLRDLQYLTELDLSNNLFSGPFPAATLLIPSLVYLDLRFNAFSGQVPAEAFAKNLDALFLNNNQFDGQIPETLWSSPATVITLANNRLTGPVPTAYGYGAGGPGPGGAVPEQQAHRLHPGGAGRPPPECDGAPGDAGLSCLRIPVARPVPCTTQASVSVGVGVTVGGSLPSFGAGGVVTVTVP